MIITIIVSAIVFVILFKLIKCVKVSPGYYYKEDTAEYMKIPVWIILLILVLIFVPYINVALAIWAIILFAMRITIDENIKFIPRVTILKFLTKKV